MRWTSHTDMVLCIGDIVGAIFLIIKNNSGLENYIFTFLSFRQHMMERYRGQLQVLNMWQIVVTLSHDSTRSHFVHT